MISQEGEMVGLYVTRLRYQSNLPEFKLISPNLSPSPLPKPLTQAPYPSPLPKPLAQAPCPSPLPKPLAQAPCPSPLPNPLAQSPCPFYFVHVSSAPLLPSALAHKHTYTKTAILVYYHMQVRWNNVANLLCGLDVHSRSSIFLYIRKKKPKERITRLNSMYIGGIVVLWLWSSGEGPASPSVIACCCLPSILFRTLEHVWTCLNMFEHVWTCLNIYYKAFWTSPVKLITFY